MGWLHDWMARETDARDDPQYRLASDGIHDDLPAVEPRDDKGNRRGNGGNGNGHNGGRRGDSADEQGGDKDKGNGGDGDKNKNSSLVRGAVDMAQTGRRSVGDGTGGQGAVDTSSWRTWHPYRPPSAQSDTAAAAADLLEPPAPAFSRSNQDARRTLNTWETSSEPDSPAADRFSATALATYLSPAPTRPRRIGGSTQV
ncbi:hypothetical protein INS49_007986 [Diaporthe citri]|uniref:uncharacterized protein n=1 Tax=Diaporthe citri TaxID=83186 RepID=UPI001C7E4837|nr:uncharacterized protein INS49_007986 [Diaporthe citri]KAG6362891.1 hypothetical protein INS49_007986 [Diaporthe citri]